MRKTKFEEIIETINKANDEGKLNVFLAIWGVTEIKNFYENRICKNCKWFDGKMYCLNEENDTYNEILDFRLLRKVSKNSTCEKFEKK